MKTKFEVLQSKLNSKAKSVDKEAVEKELVETSPVNLLGSSVINPVTGETVMELRNWFCAVPQVGTPTFAQDPGQEILKELARPSDLKARVLALTGASDISQLYGGDDTGLSDEEIMDGLNSEETEESDEFNQAMKQSPYYCDENGVSNFEKALATTKEERQELQKFMAQSADPTMQAILALPQEQRDALLAQARAVLDQAQNSGAGGSGDTTDGDQ